MVAICHHYEIILGLKMQPDSNERPISNGPKIEADTWFALALAAFIIAIVIFSAVAIWVFAAEGAMNVRAQAFAPFGVAIGAIVTFFTIAWRGVLNTTQLTYQAAQLEHQANQLAQTRRQNDSKDEENLAKLLMDGTKLLGDDKESHVLAGVAALQAVVTSARPTFAPHAMDILADLLEATHADIAKRKVFNAAKDAINSGAAKGHRAQRSLRVDFSALDAFYGVAINGVNFIRYVGATFYSDQFDIFEDVTRVRFENCTFEECKLPEDMLLSRNCAFEGCTIAKFSSNMVSRNSFSACDFSGAQYSGSPPNGKKARDGTHSLSKLKADGNYFRAENPIKCRGSVDWSLFLECDDIEIENLEDEDTVTESESV
jgi:hypothetical protein